MAEVDLTLDFEPEPQVVVRFLRAFCSSIICCKQSIKPTMKAQVWLDRRKRDNFYYSRPIDCPDCSSALHWRRIIHGSLDDPIIDL